MAAKFDFRLQIVLEERARRERVQQGVVGQVQSERTRIQQRAAIIQADLASGRRGLRDMMTGEVDASAVRRSGIASLHGLLKLQRIAVELAGCHRRLETAQAELTARAVARKAVETLRAQQLAAFKARINRLEAAELDDIITMRAGTYASQGRASDSSHANPHSITFI